MYIYIYIYIYIYTYTYTCGLAHSLTVLHLVPQCCLAVSCSVLQCIVVCCSALQCIAVYYSMLQYIAVYCSVSQCIAVYCSVLIKCIAGYSSVLYCVLQHVAVYCRRTSWRHEQRHAPHPQPQTPQVLQHQFLARCHPPPQALRALAFAFEIRL